MVLYDECVIYIAEPDFEFELGGFNDSIFKSFHQNMWRSDIPPREYQEVKVIHDWNAIHGLM